MANVVRKANKRQLAQCRVHAADIEYYLNRLEEIYRPDYPHLADAMHVARELNAQLDDLIDKINGEI